ncbi:MAG: 3-phosphoshikimate 1-carboxyvinyltransferase [Thalassobaculales bacterium]
MSALISRAAARLSGSFRVPGDKSISHRAVMFGGLAVGETVIDGLLEGEDVMATAAAIRAFGGTVVKDGARWRVRGRGVGGFAEPEGVLDLGNSGTSTRLLLGIAAGHPFTTFMTGDASLVRRPMARVTTPLERMGARFVCRSGGRLPLAVTGSDRLLPIDYTLPVASAQVKSAVLLAGLAARGATTVIEPEPTRDHTERMLRAFGAAVTVTDTPAGRAATVVGQPELSGCAITVPGDPSSAAFPAVAALIVPEAELRLPGVGLNPLRAGLYATLAEMGADLVIENRREQAGELVGDLVLRSSALKGVTVPPERAPSMIDEYPVLAVAAAFAEGDTVMRGIGELKVKESDRLTATARGLAACGVSVEAGDDYLIVHGRGRPPAGGASIAANLDHRIAMAFLVMGMGSAAPVAIDDGATIATSFPSFVAGMNALGAAISAG